VSEARAQTIVVVEDEEEVRALVDRILTDGGYRVVSTTDPFQTVELVRRVRPDLLITDIGMPAMDGYEVLRALQADAETARVPVVFLSGHRDFSERVRAFREGVVDYLAKPFTREVLLKKIERVLDARQRRPDAAEPEPGAADGAAAQDPPSLSGTPDRMPSFDEFPPVVRHVLVVDDNTVFRKFVRDLLASRGFTVREASNGEEGLRAALEHRPWLILTDVRMPAGDGFEFCRRVRSHSIIRQTPLLFLSGWDDYKQRYQGLRLGADDFLSKESSIRELLVRIQLLMKRYADLDTRGAAAGMQGEIQVIGAPGVLQVCHLSRLTGVLSAQDGPWRASVRFRDGEIVGAECGAARGEDAVFEFLGWESGTFHFAAGDPGPGERVGDTFDRLLLEGCRRLDEARREEGEADGGGAS
jgi:two-component system cell cycle response regulator